VLYRSTVAGSKPTKETTMNLKDCVSDYLRFILYERGLSANTHKGYQAQLRHFIRWLETDAGYQEPTTDCLTVPVARRFLYYLAAKNLRPRSIISYFDPLDGLCTFLVENRALQENPVKSLVLPKKDKPRRATVSQEQIERLFAACGRDMNPRVAAQRRAVLSVLVYAGVRRAELCDLRLDDVNLTDKSLTVRLGKGAKGRTIYLCDDCIAALQAWIQFRPRGCQHPYLFTTDRSRRLHYHALANLIETLKVLADLRDCEAIKPHGIRHFSGTNLLRNGADIRSVQAFLGHAQLSTTAIYLHSDEQQLRSVSSLTALAHHAAAAPVPADNVIPFRRPERQHDAATPPGGSYARTRRLLNRIAG
jgi:integrase/recombinase XerD